MRPARFVTLSFVYCGLLLLVQQALVYGFSLGIADLARVGVALAILLSGVSRLRNPESERDNPAEYGFLAYGMAALSVLLTGILVGQLLVR